MKVVVVVLVTALTGCVTNQPNNATPEQRALAMQYFLGHQNPVRPYVLPTPQAHAYQQTRNYDCVQNIGSGPTTYSCQSQ